MAKRKRDIQLKFRVTPQEREMIETKMAQFGTTNTVSYTHLAMILDNGQVPQSGCWSMDTASCLRSQMKPTAMMLSTRCRLSHLMTNMSDPGFFNL